MLISYKKLIPALIAGSIVSLTSGCNNMSTEKKSNHVKANYPTQTALDSMGEFFQNNVTNLSVTQHVNSGESPDKAIVTIEESGLQDDSIAAEQTIFTMHYQKDKWKIINRVKQQRCWPERGHQDFSALPCR